MLNRPGAPLLECSTPFGITDHIGSRPPARVHRPPVLNAFRHHGSYRIAPVAPAPARLIVLNAFRHHGSYRLVLEGDRRPRRPVLNAFRHHGSYRAWPVLNAFRHHGSYRGRLSDSTNGALQVLNAFRHHGSYRVALRVYACLRLVVLNAFRHHGSYRLQKWLPTKVKLLSAQRLSASRIISVQQGQFPMTL